MHRTTYRILFALFALALTGCGGATRPIRYYTIQVPVAPTLSTNPYPVSLLVANITGPAMYRDTPIAYRVGSNEIGVYHDSRWAEPPAEMLKTKLIRMLHISGNYESVAGVGTASAGQFVIRGRLHDFEEVDSGSIAALVSMEFELCDRKTGKVLWSHFYSQSEPVQGREISAVVAALDVNLDRGLKEVAAGLNEYFAANLPKKS